MSLKLGNGDVTKVMLGSTEVSAVYKGADEVWSSGPNIGPIENITDRFSTYLYTGTGADRDIVNDIDLEGEGGLVWIKARNTTNNSHILIDTERGAGNILRSNSTAGNDNGSGPQATLTKFNSNGFSLGKDNDNWGANFQTGNNYASWTFRKAKNFFDVVTYTGDGVAGLEIPHNLGCEPGVIIVKRVDANTVFWCVYHRDLSGTQYMSLNTTNGATTLSNIWNDTDPTDTHFTLGPDGNVNRVDGEYVAYLFAHDDSDESIIKCGSYTGTGAAGNEIYLGWEPQWLLVKSTTTASDSWILMDTMRGIVTGEIGPYLWPNSRSEEYTANMDFDVTPTGFKVNTTHESHNGSGEEYIYMAIRRPNKPAEEFDPDELFAMFRSNNLGNMGGPPGFRSEFPVDMAFWAAVTSTLTKKWIGSRLQQGEHLFTNSNTAADTSSAQAGHMKFDYNNGYYSDGNAQYQSWMWRRAPGFFDVVAYEGDGQAGRELSHHLAVKPEMIWTKCRDFVDDWGVWYTGSGNANESITKFSLNEIDAPQFLAHPQIASEQSFQPQGVYGNAHQNFAGQNYIAYLFASVPGISAIGTYTGDGSGYQVIYPDGLSGASIRFVLVKRVDGTGNWMMFDRERGTDAALSLNLTDAQKTGDFWSWTFGAFGVKNNNAHGPEWNPNTNGAEYLYYAITL